MVKKMKIEFYKSKDFGRGITSGIRWQRCYRPSRTHENQLSIGILFWKWQRGITVYWKELTEEQIEDNERVFR